jgi:hypothetical protein
MKVQWQVTDAEAAVRHTTGITRMVETALSVLMQKG